ncbi:unnamed protein product [Phytomonas sp. EM1]|nr:unnamed protein product [Phytomonas sp. EM1]|eukprot:CCW60304.1 unnamed protein product [Phytomonas sp. isolate EM1]
MSLNSTIVCRYVPLIRFTHAIAKSGVVPPVVKLSPEVSKVMLPTEAKQPMVKTITDKASQITQVIYDSFNDLPQYLQPKLLSEDDIERIMMGGADPYTPKHLKKKK